MIKLLTDEKILKQIKANTSEKIKEHSLPNIINIWEETYKKLIKEKKNQ